MKALWGTLFAGFAAVNIYAFAVGGLSELADYLRNLGPWGLLVVLDLLLALIISVNWMWLDAKAKCVAPLPYAVLTVMTGSLGLLLYLARHDGAPHPQAKDDGDLPKARIEAA